MVEIRYSGDALWERIERAGEKVKQRLRRVTRALNAAGIPYAVIGGNAVQQWVAQVDESVVRNTRDVDIILNESDFEAAIAALATEGFIYRRSAGVTRFLDGPGAKARDAVHVVFAGEKVREEYPEPVPQIDQYVWIEDARTLPLERLVRMKLTSYRDKDRVHVRDMISIADRRNLARPPAGDPLPAAAGTSRRPRRMSRPVGPRSPSVRSSGAFFPRFFLACGHGPGRRDRSFT